MTRKRIDPLIALILIAATLLGGWMFVVDPQLVVIKTLQTQQQAITTANTLEAAKLQDLQNQYLNLPNLQSQLAELQARLPAKPNVAEFVAEVGSAANDSGIAVTTIVPGAPVAYVPVAVAATPSPAPKASATPSASATPTPRAGELYTIQVTITASGTRSQADLFIEIMQRSGRLYILNSVGTAYGASGSTVINLTGYIFVVLAK
jgi:hypothetical protein